MLPLGPPDVVCRLCSLNSSKKGFRCCWPCLPGPGAAAVAWRDCRSAISPSMGDDARNRATTGSECDERARAGRLDVEVDVGLGDRDSFLHVLWTAPMPAKERFEPDEPTDSKEDRVD